MKLIKTLIIFSTLLGWFSQAEMVKCDINSDAGKITNYFDNKDKKERKKCLNKPKRVVSARGENIQNTYKNSEMLTSLDELSSQATALSNQVKKQTKSSHQYKTNYHTKVRIVPLGTNEKKKSCSSKGGTITINGRLFHIDPDSLCNRYHSNRHVQLAQVDKKFRKKISGFINKTAKKQGVEPAFVHAIISAESGYHPNATSSVGAMGLMQLMPFTANRFGVKNAYDPYQNIRAGVKYLKLLIDEFGSLELAAAGYNAGEGAVRKYKRIPPYRETLDYVPKVMGYYQRYKQNKKLIAQQ